MNQARTDLGRQDLITVLDGLRRTNGHLLSASEASAIQAMIDLPFGAGRLLAQLLARRHSCLRLKSIDFTALDDQSRDLELLIKDGFLIELHHSPTRTALFTKKELTEWCKSCGVESKGKKDDLLRRVSDLKEGPPGLTVHVVHRDLVDWCEWIFFGGGRGRRKRFVLGRIGASVWAQYSLTPGTVAFESRAQLREFLAYSTGKELSIPDLLGKIAALPERSPSHRNFDLRRRMGKELIGRVWDSETKGEVELSLFLVDQALKLRVGNAGELLRRKALCLSKLDRRQEAAAVCQAAIVDAKDEEALALNRTGRRLARAAGVSWIPPRPLLSPRSRRIGLSGIAGFTGLRGEIERQVVGLFPEREMVHGEGRLWTSLFVLLFFDLLWMPVDGMLPAPCLDGPLDLGRKEFAVRRRSLFLSRLNQIGKGASRRRIGRSLKERGVRIKGMDWGLASDSQWKRLLSSIPGPFLKRVMKHLGEEGFSAASGLPDLFVWPGKQQRHSCSFPSKLGTGALLVEVKGPNDSLQDNQRVWHDRLLRWKFPVEVWRVEELDSFYANYGRTTERTKATPSKGRDGPAHFRPGPGGTLFDSGPEHGGLQGS
jgi:hypothetical protein